MDFLELCRKLISIESTPTTGNAECAQFCASVCQSSGLETTFQESTLRGQKQFNLIARPKNFKKGQEEIIFQSHLDTVEPGPLSHWTKTDSNPFRATIEGDKIYGLGTADVKLDFLCKLRALESFKDKKLSRPFALVGTFGEEIGMHGAKHLMESGDIKAKMALIGEPSELQIVYANNGYMVTEFRVNFSDEEVRFLNLKNDQSQTQEKLFRGKAAHSSTPHLGENAILKLFDYLEKLPQGTAVIKAVGGSSVNTVPADAEIEIDGTKAFKKSVGDRLLGLMKELKKLERQFLNFENQSFSPPHPTLNPGLLTTTADAITLLVSFRITPDVSTDQINQWENGLKTYCDTNGITLKRSRLSPPAFTKLDSYLVTEAVKISKGLKLSEKPITKASGTECSVYTNFGLDCIVFGPGVSIGNSHTANEYNFISHLEKASQFYTEAAKRFCL